MVQFIVSTELKTFRQGSQDMVMLIMFANDNQIQIELKNGVKCWILYISVILNIEILSWSESIGSCFMMVNG